MFCRNAEFYYLMDHYYRMLLFRLQDKIGGIGLEPECNNYFAGWWYFLEYCILHNLLIKKYNTLPLFDEIQTDLWLALSRDYKNTNKKQ